MPSETRADSLSFITESFENYLRNESSKRKKCLYVGVAGNKKINGRPVPEMHELYEEAGYDVYTADFDKAWGSDFIVDICDPELDLQYNPNGKFEINWDLDIYNLQFDLIVITQVLEHTKKPWAIINWLNLNVAKDGYFLIDCPWGKKSPDYHAEPPSFGDYWRISLDGLRELFTKQPTWRGNVNELLSFQSDALAAILCKYT